MNQVEVACAFGLDTIEDTLDKAEITNRQIVILVDCDEEQVKNGPGSAWTSAGCDDPMDVLALILNQASQIAEQLGIRVGIHRVHGGPMS